MKVLILGIGHGALGIGHWAWGMGHWALGIVGDENWYNSQLQIPNS
ncbi:MAG: hypothetical protein RMY62_000695 [Nostoc sp. ZfuVER08]|uniref:Uncharacterized protein n=1 Tax=Nostoc punctiforme FACHB-252 TaxID=1357509 RepID=A0ABR8H6M2_NOSPU|nr:hypothetical protein [Nostoc punctiforme]MBD2611284.1 hypothetical protein [Nostoc punctiforme FACHB-252]MDZ8015476.1 hypothetical protein [Nostoc sp. ZfuVER08]